MVGVAFARAEMGIIIVLNSSRNETNEKSLLTSKLSLSRNLWLFYEEVEGVGKIQYTVFHTKSPSPIQSGHGTLEGETHSFQSI